MTTGADTGWPTRRLGDLAEFRNGVNYNKSSFGEGVKVVGVSGFQDYVVPKYAELDQINPAGIVTARNILHDGDILFVRSNGNPQLIGRSLFVEQPPEEVTHSAFTIRLRFRSKEVYPKFYAYCFRTPLIRQALSAYGGGTNISNLNQDILGALEIPLPPFSVQRRLADVLWAYDGLMENCQRRIQILETMARALYREWFVEFRFPGSDISTAIRCDDEPPRDWSIGTVANVTSFLARGISPIYDEQGTSVVINQKCIRDQRLSLVSARRQRKVVPAERMIRTHDVLINSTGVGTLGRVAQVLEELDACTVDTHVTIARPNDDIDPHYSGYALLARENAFERLGTGATGQTELSRTAIGGVELMLPPHDLQRRFGLIVQPMRTSAVILAKQIANLRATRDLLLPRLLSGQLALAETEAAVP